MTVTHSSLFLRGEKIIGHDQQLHALKNPAQYPSSTPARSILSLYPRMKIVMSQVLVVSLVTNTSHALLVVAEAFEAPTTRLLVMGGSSDTPGALYLCWGWERWR